MINENTKLSVDVAPVTTSCPKDIKSDSDTPVFKNTIALFPPDTVMLSLPKPPSTKLPLTAEIVSLPRPP